MNYYNRAARITAARANLDTLNTLIVNSLNMEVEQEMTSFCPGSNSLLPACWPPDEGQ